MFNHLVLKYYDSFTSYGKSNNQSIKLKNIKTGKIEVLYNIKRFADKYNLNRGSLSALIKGKLKTTQGYMLA